jgi:Putative ATP-binding cassette/Transglutaminase-like superfamily
VNALLEKKPTISLPSAREVLRTRVGDCNEHTALYVALARALDIPARIAVGLVRLHGAFNYHAWAEVYVEENGRGLWLPVDPTLNEFPADATHIRLSRGGLDKLTVVSNRFLGALPFLQVLCAAAIVLMSFGLVGLAAGLGARYPRFSAENLTQVAGSYGGVAFMVLAVLFILVTIALLAWPASLYLWSQYNRIPLTTGRRLFMGLSFFAAAALSVVVFVRSMRSGIKALEDMG